MPARPGILSMIAISTACAFLVGCGDSQSGGGSEIDPSHNLIVISSGNEILWNGNRVTLDQLRANLERSRDLPVEPELQFEPAASASYERSADVLNVIKDSGVSKFGFVGNEKYVTPGK